MVSKRTRNLGIGSGITFTISLGTAIPALGIFLGPFFTFGGGLVGGGVGGWLESSDGRSGLKAGLIVALVGGITSSIVAVTGGTLLNAVFVADDGSGSAGGWILIAAFGFVSGIAFTLFGGALGGAVGGVLGSD